MRHSARKRWLRISVLALLAAGSLAACSMDSPNAVNASTGGGGNSGVTMREVVGDFCPPAQATKGNC